MIIIISLIFKIENDYKDLENECGTKSLCKLLDQQKRNTERDRNYCIAGLVCIIVGWSLKILGISRE